MGEPARSQTDAAELAQRRLTSALPPHVGWVPAEAARAVTPPSPPAPSPPRPRLVRELLDRARSALPPGLADLPVRAVGGLLVLAVIGAMLGAGFLWRGRPRSLEAPAAAPVPVVSSTEPVPAPPGGAGPSAPASPAGQVVVHVAGSVRSPGLVRLPAGARVADAVRAAGGVTARGDPASVNLARPLVDGEQVVLLRKGSMASGASASGASASGAVAPPGSTGVAAPSLGTLDLNAATPDQLQQLPGVGPVLAGRIVQWRTQHGRFTSVDELREVSGIGERKFADLAGAVHV